MVLKRTFKPILNKFHLKNILHLIFLIFLVETWQICSLVCDCRVLVQETRGVETLVEPEAANIGDTVLVKIKREEKNGVPKVYFDKTKLPIFLLSDSWYRTFIPLSADIKPGTYKIEIFYHGQLKKIDLNINPTKYPLQELTLTKEVAALRASKIEKALVASALDTKSNKKLWSTKFIYPSSGPQSTVYGVKRRVNGVINPDYFHKGLDFAAPFGSDVKAPENGKIILVGSQSKGFVVNGNCIFLDHGHGIVSGYLHLSKILVKEGDFVRKGQLIGKVGSSGIASGPHLHWGIYVFGKTVDPMYWTNMTIE